MSREGVLRPLVPPSRGGWRQEGHWGFAFTVVVGWRMNKLGALGAPHRLLTRASSSAGGTRRIYTYVQLIHVACTAYGLGLTQKSSDVDQ
eukprot:7261855-Ditylum_brightwellii.AAC.1